MRCVDGLLGVALTNSTTRNVAFERLYEAIVLSGDKNLAESSPWSHGLFSFSGKPKRSRKPSLATKCLYFMRNNSCYYMENAVKYFR